MDKYRKIKNIGEGSFGKAVLVKHKENGLQYVVKVTSVLIAMITFTLYSFLQPGQTEL